MESCGLNFPHWTITCHTSYKQAFFAWIKWADFSVQTRIWIRDQSHPLALFPRQFCMSPMPSPTELNPVCLCVMFLRQGKGLLSHLFLKSPNEGATAGEHHQFLRGQLCSWNQCDHTFPGEHLEQSWDVHGCSMAEGLSGLSSGEGGRCESQWWNLVVIQVCFNYLMYLKDSQVTDVQYLKRLLLSIFRSYASLL